MAPNPWVHPSLRDFGFQHTDITAEADAPPSPSTDHSETLSDLYGDEPEVPWVIAIGNNAPNEVADDPEFQWFTGEIGYRTCYKNVSDERWSMFKTKFEAQVLNRWRYEAGLGADPDGDLAHWKVFWYEDEALEGAEVPELRIKFGEDIKEYHGSIKSAASDSFIFVDEQAVKSLLDDSDEEADGEKFPYIWVAHVNPDVTPDAEYPDKYEGHYKLPVERVCDFWEFVGMNHMDMAGFAPDRRGGLGGAAFDTMYR